jgi:uncharacterized repeat protein (TIGR02543 family)
MIKMIEQKKYSVPSIQEARKRGRKETNYVSYEFDPKLENFGVELPVPKKAGAIFLGWYETEDFSGEPVTVLTAELSSDKTFYARWGAEFNITYHLDGGVNHPDNPDKYNTAYLPLVLGVPTKENHLFLGWYTEDDFSGEPITELPVTTEGDITLYAKWKADVVEEEYTITYVLNGGVNASANPETYKSSDLPLVLAEPTRTGYEFLGWYETEDFSGEPVTVLDENASGNKKKSLGK